MEEYIWASDGYAVFPRSDATEHTDPVAARRGARRPRLRRLPDQDVEGPKVISRVGGIRVPPLYRSVAGDIAETVVEPRPTTR
jgi:hypothetical protein